MKAFKKVIWKVLRLLRLAAPLQLLISGYLYEKKWVRSFYSRSAIDQLGDPIPWLSYPFIHFLNEKMEPSFDVFEYGSGHSTLWFAKRAHSVTSVEHNRQWFDWLSQRLPVNVQLRYQELVYDGDYARAIQDHDRKFDIVLIDGRDRVNCVKYALPYLTDAGVFIVDNTDRVAYRGAFEFLEVNGFKSIAFEGMSPGTHVTGCTSIFYRPLNCFSI